MSKRQNQLGGLPMWEEKAAARRTDPETSHEAAAKVRVTDNQTEVLELFKWVGGPCPDQLIVALAPKRGCKQSPSGLRTRRHELVTKGYLKHVGFIKIDGNRHRTWGLTEKGEAS